MAKARDTFFHYMYGRFLPHPCHHSRAILKLTGGLLLSGYILPIFRLIITTWQKISNVYPLLFSQGNHNVTKLKLLRGFGSSTSICTVPILSLDGIASISTFKLKTYLHTNDSANVILCASFVFLNFAKPNNSFCWEFYMNIGIDATENFNRNSFFEVKVI